MPGFAEFDKHDSSFNMKLSKKEVKKQLYQNKAYNYIKFHNKSPKYFNYVLLYQNIYKNSIENSPIFYR